MGLFDSTDGRPVFDDKQAAQQTVTGWHLLQAAQVQALRDKEMKEAIAQVARQAQEVVRPSGEEVDKAAGQLASLMNQAIDRRDKHLVEATQLPEAMARDQVLQLVRIHVDMAVERDRRHREDDGWIRRDRAAQDLWEMLAEVLTDEHVPADHRDTILGRTFKRLDDWAGQPKEVSS